MALLSHFKQHRNTVLISVAASLLTINIISPFPFIFAQKIATYAPYFVFAFVAIGFVALHLRHKFIMLACFLSSIVLCDFLHNTTRIATNSVKITNSDILKPILSDYTKAKIDTHQKLTSNDLMRYTIYKKKPN